MIRRVPWIHVEAEGVRGPDIYRYLNNGLYFT